MSIQFTDVLSAIRPFATKAEAEAGTSTSVTMSPLRTAEAIAELAVTPTNLTAAQIVDLLQSLNGENRLHKDAIKGADFALNYRGSTDMSQYAALVSAYPNKRVWDFWIHNNVSFGNSPDQELVNYGDWIICLNENSTFELSYQTSGEWMVVPFGTISIKNRLQLLNGVDRLNKSAIRGADMALNFQAITDMSQYVTLTNTYTDVQSGDLWIHDGNSFGGVNDGDWIMALIDDATFEAAYQTSEWLVLPRSTFTSIGEIVTALEALTTTNRLNKSAIRGGDYSLNYRGAGDLYGVTFQATMVNIMKGDMWVMVEGTGLPSDGEPNLLVSGDVVFATQDNPGNFNYYTGYYWIKIYITNKARTESLTNKRILPRVLEISSSSQPTVDTDLHDALSITTLGEAIATMSTNWSGTPANMERFIIRIKDNGVARSITWNTASPKFTNKGATLPLVTIATKLVTITLEYDTQTNLWNCINVAQEPDS